MIARGTAGHSDNKTMSLGLNGAQLTGTIVMDHISIITLLLCTEYTVLYVCCLPSWRPNFIITGALMRLTVQPAIRMVYGLISSDNYMLCAQAWFATA